MEAADAIVAEIGDRHRNALEPKAYARFLEDLRFVVEHQRATESADLHSEDR